MAKKPISKETTETKLVRELAKILDQENLSEIEMEKGDLRLRVTRQLSAVATMPAPVQMPTAPQAAPQSTPQTDKAEANNSKNAINSPMVGTVYLRPSPDDAPFVKIGDKVKAGDTVLLVEAMKTFNPIKADKAGIVQDILVEDGQPVEFGEALLIVT